MGAVALMVRGKRRVAAATLRFRLSRFTIFLMGSRGMCLRVFRFDSPTFLI